LDSREDPNMVAARQSLRPYRAAIRNVGCLLFVGSCLAANAGLFIVASGLFAVLAVGFFGLATWILRRSTPDGDRRGHFLFSLDMAGLGADRLPPGCVWGTFPVRVLLEPLSLARPFIVHARRGEAGRAWIRERLSATDPYARWQAAVTLGRLHDETALAALAAALADPDEEVRQAAAAALGTMGEAAALEPALNDNSDDLVWLQAAAVEYRRGHAPDLPEWRMVRLGNELQGREEIADETIEALVTLPMEATEDLLCPLIERGGTVALRVATTVGERRDAPARAFLLRLLCDEHPQTIRLALHGLARLRDVTTFSEVEPFANYPAADIRRCADLALTILRREAARSTPDVGNSQAGPDR
jgi:hypothetical protein